MFHLLRLILCSSILKPLRRADAAGRVALAALGLLLVPFLPALLLAQPAFADEGWVINSFDAQITITSDGSLRIAETILADFGSQSRHGIYRDIPVVYDFGDNMNRVYDLNVASVTDGSNRPVKYEVSREGSYERIKIGDANVTVSGAQTYRITYTVRGALNGFSDHDELYWNVNGQWPVRTQRTTARVTLPGDGVQDVTCYQGPPGSQDYCRYSNTTRTATFSTTRALAEGEELTIVVAMPKGLVPNPQPILEQKPRDFPRFFEVTPSTVAGGLLVLIGSLGALGWAWWRFGRDRRYTTIYYLTDNPSEETRPLLSSDPIVVEYKPPEDLRPGQLGLILDETADTVDATATIVDLAVRGYLSIREVKEEGLLNLLSGQPGEAERGGETDGDARSRAQALVQDAATEVVGHGFVRSLFPRRDWELKRLDKDTADLLPYERTLLDGIFASGSTVKLSSLKRMLYKSVATAKSQLYADAMGRRWFAFRPDIARGLWAGIGIGVIVLGAGLTYLLGNFFGAGVIGLAFVVAGILLTTLSHWMPKRTAKGREVLRRTLGFRQYVATAEKDRQRFNEQSNLFSEYLPYAIVFHCVDKWARAFQGIDMAAATRSWYYGTSGFAATQFSSDLQSFSSTVSSTIVSTPGGSGGSGFGGGSAGGGGGGGGGGSW